MSIYHTYSDTKLTEHFSNFLIDSWSYSKLNQFARNEKAFEMYYIYGEKSKSSASAVSGQAYHFALDRFFNAKKKEEDFDLADLEAFAFDFIDEVPAYTWKIQKTTPTVNDCKAKALKTVTLLLRNFYGEMSTYLDDIEEIIDVEVYIDEFLTINGVDIPLPCHMRIDLVVRTKAQKTAIIDHKSKASFSDEQDMKLGVGVQAITYIKGYEAKTGIDIDEVWFVENKYSQNKDKSKQLNKFKIEVDASIRRLYEAILYEPLRKMIQAVNDPDYTYIINDSDNFIDKSELFEFWCKTMLAEIEDFPINPSKKDLIEKRLKKIRDASVATVNPKIIKQFKQNAAEFIQYDLSNKNMTPQEKIEHVLRSFGTIVKVAKEFNGYSSNTFLLEVSAGVKIASIQNHRLDIANQLNVSNVRISKDLTVYEGKSYLSVEFSKERDRDLLFNPHDLVGRKIPLGRDNYGNVVYWDLDNHSTPHALVCGATGSGKSVSVRSTIEYALLGPADFIIILDPKYEFKEYASHPKVKVFNEIIEIEDAMTDMVDTMNDMVKAGQQANILIIFDEFADAVASSRKGKELIIKEVQEIGTYANGNARMGQVVVGELKPLEENLRIILQKGRSTGIRVMAATQRASVKVITGDAKVNFPIQISFRVPKEADSRVVLDEAGAEALTGKGDGLIKSPEYNDTVRFQAYFKK